MSARNSDPWSVIEENGYGERLAMRDRYADFATVSIDGTIRILAKLHESGNWPKVSGYRRAELTAAYARLRRVMLDLEGPASSERGNVVTIKRTA